LFPMNLSRFISVNQAVSKLIMRFADGQKWVNFFFWRQKDFLNRLNGIKKSQILQLTV
jgi:hypothetical protein